MKQTAILPAWLLAPFFLYAQARYPAAAIPSALLKQANVVVRTYTLQFEVHDKGSATQTEHKVFTVLNETGARRSELHFPYSRFAEIEDIEAAVYDAEGKLVRELKRKDIEDVKPAEHFVNDHRYKVLRLPARAFPYTIEYRIVTQYKGLMFYPVFQPQETPSEAVESARFEVKMPEGLSARFKAIHMPPDSKTGPLRWEFHNLNAFRREAYMPVAALELPEIITAPAEFSFGGVSGKMDSWESYGRFLQQLNSTQQDLPAEVQAMLRGLVADCPDAACKVERLYHYLQENTRYFFVGLGIGGWQPAPAAEVHQLKYGDCKGLSNYMVAMLRAVDVPAFYAVIRAGEDEQTQYPDFPNALFNHAIACAPLGKDTVWLECTSQEQSCGFMGTFTDNRPALLITPEGGKLVTTPRYDETRNTIRRETEVTLSADGRAFLKSEGVFQGIAQNLPAELAGYAAEIQHKYFYEALNINDFEIKKLTFQRRRARLPRVEQSLELDIPKLASGGGKRLFIPISLLSAKIEVPAADSSRRHPVQADARGHTESDVMNLLLPEGYRLESPFDAVRLDSDFGHFELSVQQEAGKIQVRRMLVLNNRIRPAAAFGDLAAFLKAVAKADKSKLVLVKQT